MNWLSLNFLETEQLSIHACITKALCELIASKRVKSTDEELVVTGKLRPFLARAKKELKLSWVLQPEASCFANEEDTRPEGHPDIRFSAITINHDQYDYDVECKLVRVKRKNRTWDYCKHYVDYGIKRYQDGKYAKSEPPMGTIIGYVQECVQIGDLLNEVNNHNHKSGYNEIRENSLLHDAEVSHLTQEIERKGIRFTLHHKWADLRS